MQIAVNVPDSLPKELVQNRIKEFEASLQEEALKKDTEKWNASFAESQDVLELLAIEANEEHRAGKTKEGGWHK